ncbi:MAG TPA: condensation domain-containing protein, partial [Pyrinomonadaceae bacterium]|nr:condensation domain-containing protein [Pyrinomonadaceae bacterium]
MSIVEKNLAEEVFIAPLSFAQQRLWFLHQLEPESAAYNIQAEVRIEGKLEHAALERSLNEVVRRHESFRTSFLVSDEQVWQVITPELTFHVEHVDLRHLSSAERESEAQRLVRQAARKPFDPEQSPLLRGSLLRLGDESHILLLVMDHIISDGWSIGILIKELTLLYQAYSLGQQSSPLAPLETQYIDYAEWQRDWLAGDALNEQLSYWKEKLRGNLPVLELPADRPRPPVQSDIGAVETILLSQSLTESLKALGQQHGATLFMTLLAAFQAFLQRYTGQPDILIGTPIAGRTQPETEDIIGCFVNTLVLRNDLSGDPSFTDILSHARATMLEAHANQDLPFETLVSELQPERNMSHTPLFQVMLVLHPPLPEIKLPGLTLKQIEVENETAKFDLMFSFREEGHGLVGFLEYRTERFDASTVKRMGEHYQRLLKGIVANPSQRLSTLPLLSDDERQHLLLECNDTATPYPRQDCLHH